MRNVIIIIIILSISILLLSFKNDKCDDEKKINRILVEIISQDSTILDPNCKLVNGFNSALQIRPISYLDTSFFPLLSPYFDNSDSAFYANQILKNKNCKLHVKEFPGSYKSIRKKKIINFVAKVESDYVKEKEFDFWQRFERKIGDVQEFSLPLISKDGNYVLIRFSTYKMNYKGRGFVKIYENQNGKWISIKTIKDWKKIKY